MSDIPHSDDTNLLDQLRELPAWGISFGVHFIAVFLLMGVTYTTIIINDIPLITSMADEEEVELEDFKFNAMVTEHIGNDSDLNQAGPSLATATISGDKPETQMEERLEQDIVKIEVPQTSVLIPPSEADLTDVVEVSGDTEHTGGVEGAIDRLTYEIATSLKQSPTMVVWMFDASLSLVERREQVADRFENIYRQLGVMDIKSGNPLKTAVISYGGDVKFITPKPVDDYKKVISKVKGIPADETGKEKVFTAVEAATSQWAVGAARNGYKTMFVIVTDERGDDIEKLESVINTCKRYRIKTFCMGNASVFGKQKSYISHTWKEGNYTYTEDLPVDAGPESCYPELLELSFWGNNKSNLNRLSAEYGPYGLTRLCAETGGLYLLLEDVPRGKTFDFTIMRNYQPDYRPVSIVKNEVEKDITKRALVSAILLTQKKNLPLPTLAFRADSDNRLRTEITEAQKPVAEIEYYLNEILSTLRQGVKTRSKLREPRWRASFDLAMGRNLAMLARFYGYNAVVADMKVAPKSFKNPKSNMWKLVPSSDIGGGIAARKIAEEAQTYLKRVIDEHQGTPWQLIAAQELAQPMGWQWKEGVMFIPENVRMGNNNEPRPQFADDPDNNKSKEFMRPVPKKKPTL